MEYPFGMEKRGHSIESRAAAQKEADDIRNQSGLLTLSWTSSRCRRLLRPLQARIIALQRVVTVETTRTEQETSHSFDTDEVACQPPPKRLKVRNDSTTQRKRPQRTYSRKASAGPGADGLAGYPLSRTSDRGPTRPPQKTLASQPGVPNVSTPILRKVRYHGVKDAASAPAICGDGEGICMRPELIRRGRLGMTLNRLERTRPSYQPSTYRLYEGLLHDLDTLLRATSPRSHSLAQKSLLSMCLRKVPHYAAEVEAWEKLNTENQGPVSSIRQVSYSLGIYEELEKLGGAGNGWVHLRALLRAHAMHLLKETIAYGLLDVAFIQILIDHFKAADCAHESAELTEALLSFCCPESPAGEGVRSISTQGDALLSLAGLADHHGITPHLLETISSLLRYRRLPTSTLSNKALGFLWTISASSILEDKTNPSAVRFASAGLGLLSITSFAKHTSRNTWSNAKHNAAELTLTSVLGALSAMAMISQGFSTAAGPPQTSRRNRTQRTVLQILQEALVMVLSEGGVRKATYPILLAIFLSSYLTDTPDVTAKTKAAVKTLWTNEGESQCRGTDRDWSQLYNSTVALACSVAHCCSRATTQPSNHYFFAICKLVDELQVPRLAMLRRDGAFLLAQKTDDLRDLVFAETLTGALANQGKVPRQVEPEETCFAGYRWEEGISEWIAISPTAKRDKAIAQVAGMPRRVGRDNDERRGVLLKSGPPRVAATGAAEKSGRRQAAADAAGRPGGRQVDRRLAERRSCSTSPDKALEGEGVDELSMCQENRPPVLGKSRLSSMAIRETGRRKVLADLSIMGNLTGHGDDDELGL